jgi:hypothetical protein
VDGPAAQLGSGAGRDSGRGRPHSPPAARGSGPERETAVSVEKNARHQVRFARVNERIAELSSDRGETNVRLFICECSSQACAEALEITAAGYERVRTDGARFVVLPGHQLPDVERVIEGSGRFLVVEKLGAAAAIARRPSHATMPERTTACWPRRADYETRPELAARLGVESGAAGLLETGSCEARREVAALGAV